MNICVDCEAIVPNQPGAPGHQNLVSLGQVRTLGQAKRGARHEAFTCGACGTDWDHLHDKNDPTSGWRRCDVAGTA